MNIQLSYGENRWKCPKCDSKYQRVRHTGGATEPQTRIGKCKNCGYKVKITTELVPVKNLEVKITNITETK